MGLALLLAEDGRGEEGLGLMERAVNEAPLNPDVHNNMAAFLLTTSQWLCNSNNIIFTFPPANVDSQWL